MTKAARLSAEVPQVTARYTIPPPPINMPDTGTINASQNHQRYPRISTTMCGSEGSYQQAYSSPGTNGSATAAVSPWLKA